MKDAPGSRQPLPGVLGSKDINEREGIIMFRALTTIAAIVALAVSAAPASAGLLSSPLGAQWEGTPSGGEVVPGFIMSDGRICNPRWGC